MRYKDLVTPGFRALFLSLVLLPLSIGTAVANDGVGSSYHGQMGEGTGLGMLEKWCALPNFSFDDEGKIAGWTAKPCNTCHIGSNWNPKGKTTDADCAYCHASYYPVTDGEGGLLPEEVPTIEKCTTPCHAKDTAKRGDIFTAAEDVHIAAGALCQDCHVRMTDEDSDHQFAKGMAMDTTEPTMQGTLSCMTCHPAEPHDLDTAKGIDNNAHTAKVACETCHTGLRPGRALASRDWTTFKDGKPVTKWREAGWSPVYKWYDNTGPGASGDYHLPILGYTERRDAPGAKVYPFNAVAVSWYVKKKNSGYDDVIIVPDVKAANKDGIDPETGLMTVTLEEMQAVYRKAKLVTADMNFSISHSVVPAGLAFKCGDCHGRNGWVLDWKQLGYAKDPKRSGGKKSK